MLYCSTFEFSFPFVSNIFWGKFFISSPMFLPHKPLRVSSRKFLSIFLILFLWSHDFVVAEVCFRSLSSWMMKFLVRIFSAGPWRIWCNAGCYSELFSKLGLKSRIQPKRTFRLKREDAFLFMRDTRQRSPTSKKEEEFTSKASWLNSSWLNFNQTFSVFVGIYKDSKDSRSRRGQKTCSVDLPVLPSSKTRKRGSTQYDHHFLGSC